VFQEHVSRVTNYTRLTLLSTHLPGLAALVGDQEGIFSDERVRVQSVVSRVRGNQK